MKSRTRGHGEGATRGCESPRCPIHSSPHLPISASPRLRVSVSPRLRVSVSPRLLFALFFALSLSLPVTFAQHRARSGSHTSRPSETLTIEDRDVVERAIGVVCAERARDDKGSAPIDDMQKRPSLPLRAPEVVAGAQRAQRLLPVAKDLVIKSLRRLSNEYQVTGSTAYAKRISRAIARVQLVTRIKPDVEARDNASVYLKNPHQITFGTIFLSRSAVR